MPDTKNETPTGLLLDIAQLLQGKYATEKDAALTAASILMANGGTEERFDQIFKELKEWGADADKRSAAIAAAALSPLVDIEGVVKTAEEMHTTFEKRYSKGACAIAAANMLIAMMDDAADPSDGVEIDAGDVPKTSSSDESCTMSGSVPAEGPSGPTDPVVP